MGVRLTKKNQKLTIVISIVMFVACIIISLLLFSFPKNLYAIMIAMITLEWVMIINETDLIWFLKRRYFKCLSKSKNIQPFLQVLMYIYFSDIYTKEYTRIMNTINVYKIRCLKLGMINPKRIISLGRVNNIMVKAIIKKNKIFIKTYQGTLPKLILYNIETRKRVLKDVVSKVGNAKIEVELNECESMIKVLNIVRNIILDHKNKIIQAYDELKNIS